MHKTVVDVVHTHQGSRALGSGEGFGGQFVFGLGEEGFADGAVARRNSAGDHQTIFLLGRSGLHRTRCWKG